MPYAGVAADQQPGVCDERGQVGEVCAAGQDCAAGQAGPGGHLLGQ
jgi:hypothetical protein